jgi:hypothetical protein
MAPASRCQPNSTSGIPVAQAMGKNSTAVSSVSQLGMRKEVRSLMAAVIIRTGRRAIDNI